MKKNVILSWSGGKDACMALQKLTDEGHQVVCLVITIPKETNHSFGHGEKRELIEAQGKALNIPIHFIHCSNETYTEDFIQNIQIVKEKYDATAIAFGDLYIELHREWGVDVAQRADLEPLFPLWIEQKDAPKLLKNLIESGYKAKIIRTKDNCGLDEWLGKDIDKGFAEAVKKLDICPMGENGEYHSFVYDGPLFEAPIPLSVGENMQMETTKRVDLNLQ